MSQTNEHALRILAGQIAQISLDSALQEQAKAAAEIALSEAHAQIAALSSDNPGGKEAVNGT